MSGQYKLYYNSALCRVKIDILRSAAVALPEPPEEIVAKARAKLDAIKGNGEIGFYYIFESRLKAVWQALRDAANEPEDRKITLTVAAGAPVIAGIKIEKGDGVKAVAMLTIEAGIEAVVHWRFEWFKLNVVRKLRELGIKDEISNAQIYGAWFRAQNGERIEAMPLVTSDAAAAGGVSGKSYSVVANKKRMEIVVLIRNVMDLLDKQNYTSMLVLVNQAVKQLSADGAEYKISKKDFLGAIQSAKDGPEVLGIDLPLVLMAAVGRKRKAPELPTYPGAGKISFEVTPDKMEARISGFQMNYYDDPGFDINLEWVQNEMKRCGITAPLTDEATKELGEGITEQENLNGKLVAVGNAGRGGKEPYLHHSYKDAATRTGANLEEANLDIREMQQRTTVKTGQLIAEIRYRVPAEGGMNVYGEIVPPPASDDLVIRVGEGVQQRAGGKFIATGDGIPMIEGDSISLSKALVLNGDVNLRTGNIRFDGPVEIKGAIDSGAVVEVTGDLIVHGTIRGGQIRALGNIHAKAGIVTGPTGRVYAKGTINAEFIENSNITCKGDVVVTRAILNSSVICGGEVKVTAKSGVVAGGHISCRGNISTDNLGFRMGAVTRLDVGVDAQVASSVRTRTARLESLQKRSQDDRLALRELVAKSRAQMTSRHVEMKQELQDRLQRMRTLIEKAQKHLTDASGKLSYNMNARIFVNELLTANVDMSVGGQKITVLNDVMNVAVLPKRRRGTYILPLEEVKADDKKNGVEKAS